MFADDLSPFVAARPFKPFRMTLTNGRHYDILHPDQAAVGQSVVVIAMRRENAKHPASARYLTIALFHIIEVETIHEELTVERN